VLLQFRVIANAVRRPSSPPDPRQPVGARKLLALSMIAQAPGMCINEVARALGVRQPTASQVVKALAGLRLIDVHRDSRDGRTVRVHASGEGLRLLRGLPALFDFGDRLPNAIASLDAQSLSRLERGLDELLASLQSRVAVPRGAPAWRLTK
jgi:DNA-binding MarR family transcriptional regulator